MSGSTVLKIFGGAIGAVATIIGTSTLFNFINKTVLNKEFNPISTIKKSIDGQKKMAEIDKYAEENESFRKKWFGDEG